MSIGFACFGCGMLDFPASAADGPTNPFRGRSLWKSVWERNAVPGYESVVPLNSDSGVGADLGLKDTRSGASTLSKRARSFLQEIQSVES